MRQMKGILVEIILSEAVSKRGNHGTGMESQAKWIKGYI